MATSKVEHNLYYAAGVEESSTPKFFQDLQALGVARTDVYADPLFANLKQGDFRLKPDSPALKMGIKQIDLKGIGLTKDFRKWLMETAAMRIVQVCPLGSKGEFMYRRTLLAMLPGALGMAAAQTPQPTDAEWHRSNRSKVPGTLSLRARRRVEHPPGSGKFRTSEEVLRWEVAQTAIIICDVWDTDTLRDRGAA